MSLKNNINYSIWCDFIERDFLEDEFQSLIEKTIIHGATSNPAIFEQSISNSPAYSQQKQMLQANHPKKIYEELAITDIKRAADLLKPLHEENNNDGFVSIEVDPTLCDDTLGTIEEGTRLHQQINKENVMIKVPATNAGYDAMRELTSMGIHVNATLIFSPEQAIKCAQALNEGIIKSSRDTKAVISVFVSRFDRMCDEQIAIAGLEKGKLGIMNATMCYHEVTKFGNDNIRTLFASTGVKGDDLDPSHYINNLIYPNTVNTAPLGTIQSYMKKGSKKVSKIPTPEDCMLYFKSLEKAQIELNNVYSKLLKEGLDAFKVSFSDLLGKVTK